MYFKDLKADFDIDIDKWEVEAYASTFGNEDSMKEIVDKGAFVKTIKERFPKNLIKAFWRHRDPFGICKHIEEDSTGLLTMSKVSKTMANKDNMILIKDGAVDRMSIGYDIVKFEKDEDEEIRHLKELRLYEYSPVLIAANEETSILGMKSPFDIYNMLKAFERDYLAEGTEGLEVDEAKPYPNEHACRLRDPKDFKPESFRRTTRKHEGKEYSIIMGRLKGETKMTEQAYRYKKDIWTASSARTHCKDHDGKFEAAAKEMDTLVIPIREKIKDVIVSLQEIVEFTKPQKEKEIKVLEKILGEMRDFNIGN